MIAVESSNVKALGYNPAMQYLTVEFKNGGVYQYDEVSQQEFDAVLNAESIGKALNEKIKKAGKPYTKVA